MNEKQIADFFVKAFKTNGPTVIHNNRPPQDKVFFTGPYIELNDSKRGKFYIALIPENKLKIVKGELQ